MHLLFLFLWLNTTITVGVGGTAEYDLKHPTRTYVLPDELIEVSGLTDVDATTVACLQDEEAKLYFFDLEEGRILKSLPFGAPGDYEGLTRVGKEYFALRSDGLIHRLLLNDEEFSVVDTFRLDLVHKNIEGLGYDEISGRVLVTPKDFLKGSKETRDVRVVHAFDPATGDLDHSPALTISISRVIAQARAKGFAVPTRTTDNGRTTPALKLRLSSIAVHPITGLYYLLSAVDRILLVLDRQGDLVEMRQLDAGLFPKPEGITFMPNGDMLISNEGKDARANIHCFAMHR